jgi:3-oxoacyl-[acyl-carrier-protein] synthase II
VSARDEQIVVTGMGAIAAGVASVGDLYRVALGGRSPATWVDVFTGADPIAAIQSPSPELSLADGRFARSLDRSARLGLAATRQAVDQARISESVDLARLGILLGSSRGPVGRTLESAAQLAAGTLGPTASADSTPGSLSGSIGQALKLGGPSATIMATCASGATAIALGALYLLADEVDAVIVGGAEAPIVPLVAASLIAAGVCGSHPDPHMTCRPFDANRNGLVIGEGAAVLVLERESSAIGRGATPLARLTGWATGTDGGGRTGVTANGEGLVRVAVSALRRAGINADRVDHVNSHGTGTRLNDAVEARALNTIFGNGRVPPVTSTKPITGHCLGATAALEAVIAVESLRGGCIPPTSNHVERDRDINLDVVSGEPRAANLRTVLSTSLGFWGTQAALIFERYE